ncbi:membrane protein [Staphylococcus microti]|uniref:Membrane protein n=1 Tax=Staphylococcus microti TaxID=569857 RepID=A0A0D6XQY8_9STAP|nr:hypothetical protein [Staphylococcus microti]KIX90656.1 membrane protein [Staphylococcus microti]PNZ83865.1 hypothetical protein CD132_01485 [Staphylococcus microti]SUM56602.1 pathogenicity island protein [Staphylococcus microti]SUN02112.1 pathogenicity island protein [Staphylococcus microti]SUN02125.1 pathogenicity island protein [Staphylococcus microti]
MNQQQNEVLTDIYCTLEAVIEDKATEYTHKVREGNAEWYETVDREEHLESTMKWAMQQLENNFAIMEEY